MSRENRWDFLPDLVFIIFIIFMSALVIGAFLWAAMQPNNPTL